MPTLDEQVERFKGNEPRLDGIINGADFVTLSSGNKVPSLSQVLDTIEGPAIASQRSSQFGIVPGTSAAYQFAKQSVELAFDEQYYRSGFDYSKGLADLSFIFERNGQLQSTRPNGEVVTYPPNVPAIDERGLFVGPTDFARLVHPFTGAISVIGTFDLGPLNGSEHVLFQYVDTTYSNRIAVVRDATGKLTLIAVDAIGTTTKDILTLAAPGRIRVALSYDGAAIRLSANGRPLVEVKDRKPVSLFSLFIGSYASGFLGNLNGYVKSILTRDNPTTSTGLRMATDPAPAFENSEIQQAMAVYMKAHNNDEAAHNRDKLIVAAELAEARANMTLIAADTFTGADGTALGNTEVGAKAWSSTSIVRKGGRARDNANGFASTVFESGFADGQLEADLYPGTGDGSEASLFFRFNADGSKRYLLQKSSTGNVTLYYQGGGTFPIGVGIGLPVVDGERFKILFYGPRIWVFRIVAGVQTLIIDATDDRGIAGTRHGIRVDKNGSVDNLKFYGKTVI